MTHYRLNDSMPSAVVLSRNSRSSSLDESRIYQNNTIFLENGQEFALRLFNPLSEKIGIQIGLNGKHSNHLLVMHPGEVATLDRFVDEQKRMIFETYMYDKGNDASKRAVEKNGIVEIKFFKEKSNFTYVDSSSDWTFCNHTTNPYIYGSDDSGKYISPCTFTQEEDQSTTSGDVNIFIGQNAGQPTKSKKGKKLRSSKKGLPHFTNTKNVNYSDCSTGMGSVSNPLIYGNFDQKLEKTGKVEKGSKSDQNLHKVEVQFETYAFHTQTIYLKPISQKTSYETEVREYCTTCRYRLRNKKWNFCPKCGNDLTIN